MKDKTLLAIALLAGVVLWAWNKSKAVDAATAGTQVIPGVAPVPSVNMAGYANYQFLALTTPGASPLSPAAYADAALTLGPIFTPRDFQAYTESLQL